MTTAGILALSVTIVAALVDWWSRLRRLDRWETVSKPLATIGVIAIAALADAPGDQRLVAVLALSLCLAGDVLLMPAIDRFVFGLAAFLLGHVAFVVLFVQLGLPEAWLGGLALVFGALLVATVGNVIVRGAALRDRALKRPVVGYLAVITAMTAAGWSTGRPWVVLGSTSFVVSDSILGWRQFVRERSWMSVAVMVTYHLAIVSLALSLW